MKNFITTVITTFLVIFASVFIVYNYVPLSVFESIGVPKEPTLGATITTILGTDKISDSRTTINDNFTALNNGKFELTDWFATTTAPHITTLANLTTVGTISTGVWSGTALVFAKGGVASTSLSSNQVLLGNTTSGFKTVTGWGTSGQYLASNGAGNAPTWTTGALDYTSDYNWTGISLFKDFNASSTIANPMYLNGIDYAMPSVEGASSTALMTDGAGKLSWGRPDWGLLASTTLSAAVASTSPLSFATSTDLKIVIDLPSVGNLSRVGVQFNGDTGNNYSFDLNSMSGSVTWAGNIYLGNTNNLIVGPVDSTNGKYIILQTNNEAGAIKRVLVNGSSQIVGANGYTWIGSGIWNNTTQRISSLVVGCGGNCPINTRISVYGSRE